MYSKELEELIDLVIADGEISEKEWTIIHRKAAAEGIDPDEVEIVVEGRLAKFLNEKGAKKAGNAVPPQPPVPPVAPPAPTPSSSKHGIVNKCPICGAIVEAGIPTCAECGYAFRGIAANSSVEKFSTLLKETKEKLQSNELERQRIKSQKKGFLGQVSGFTEVLNTNTQERQEWATINSLIVNFPVPTTKEDLMEFILFLEPKTKGKITDPNYGLYGSSYKKKFEECCKKADLLFNNDPQVTKVLNAVNYYKTKKNGLFGKIFG